MGIMGRSGRGLAVLLAGLCGISAGLPVGSGAFADSYGRGAGVPPDRLPPPGLCRIWYDALPPDRQPPVMRCGRAEREAERHGGRVIFVPRDGSAPRGIELVRFRGPNDFRGIPPDRVPPPGTCRAWIDGVPPDRQPQSGSLRRAERIARREGGRVVCMPGP